MIQQKQKSRRSICSGQRIAESQRCCGREILSPLQHSTSVQIRLMADNYRAAMLACPIAAAPTAGADQRANHLGYGEFARLTAVTLLTSRLVQERFKRLIQIRTVLCHGYFVEWTSVS